MLGMLGLEYGPVGSRCRWANQAGLRLITTLLAKIGCGTIVDAGKLQMDITSFIIKGLKRAVEGMVKHDKWGST
jgi:hypothetical protein